MSFADYVAHGWRLVPIPPGTKGPAHDGWSLRENTCGDAARAATYQSAGLAHAYSGTCAVDVDDLLYVRGELEQKGISLPALLSAPDAVRIERGDPNRTKLLYALPVPLPTIKPIPGLELRCGTRNGRTVQDVLPPSMHPSGARYQWVYADDLIGDWRNLPPLPAAIRELWESALSMSTVAEAVTAGDVDPDELRELLLRLDPDSGYDDWLRIGMAVHHATGGSQDGLALWDRWSSQGEKYAGYRDLVPHWQSFRLTDDGVTVNTLKGLQVATADDFDVVEAADDDPWTAASAEHAQVLAARFAFVAIADWIGRPPPDWLVEPLLPQADLAMVYGQSGSGKTFWALDLALHLASAAAWCGLPTKPGAVAWIAAEAAGSVRNRALAHAGARGSELIGVELHVTGETPDLSDSAVVAALIVAAKAVAPVVIVVDTLAAASGGANENSGEDMNAVLAACRALHAATGALILLIHHSGKDQSKGARGWSGIKAAVDTEIEITHGFDGGRMATVTKQRDGEPGVSYPFALVAYDTSCAVEQQHEAHGEDKFELFDEGDYEHE